MRIGLFTAVSSIALFAGSAVAQTAPGTSQPSRLDDVVITGTPFGVTDRASLLATEVLDEEDLAIAPSTTLGDLVNGLPGVRSTDFAPGASRPVIRGLAGPRVQVLTNGLGLIDASSVSPDHQVAVDPAEARRIEIVRGPSTLVFGGSAIGGVVNILDDRIPTERPDGGFDGHVSSQYSTVDDGRSLGARLKADAGPLVLTLDGFTRRASDYDVPVFPESRRLLEEEGEEAGDERTVENTFVELDQYGAGASWIGSRGYIGVSAKRVDTRYGVPGHEHEHDHAEEDEEGHAEEGVSIGLEQTRYDLRGALTFDQGPFREARISGGWADYAHTEFEGDEVGTQFFSDGFEGRVELIQRERDGWQGVVGMQALDRTFDAIGDEAYVPRTDIEEQGVYTVQRWDRGAFGLQGGLRFDSRQLSSAAATRGFDNLSASAGVFGRPGTGVFLGLTLARNERAPSEVELFAEGAHVATGAFEIGVAIGDRGDDIPQRDAARQPLQPAAGLLGRVLFRLDTGNHPAVGGDLNGFPGLNPLEPGRQVLAQVGDGDARHSGRLYMGSVQIRARVDGECARLGNPQETTHTLEPMADARRAPGLIQRYREELQVRHYARRTVNTYEQWLRRFLRFHRLRHPREMGSAEVNAFLSHLAVERKVSASTQNQALASLLFLYRELLGHDLALEELVRARTRRRLPVVLTPQEVRADSKSQHGLG